MKLSQVCSLSALLGTAVASVASAADYTWNLSTNGAWDTSSANWTGAGSVWVNSSANDAFFSGTPVLVTANQNITANTLTFDASGYTLTTGNGSTLTLAGAGAGITTNFSAAASVSLTIGLAGTNGFTKAGTGRIVFNTAATYSGATTISAGVIQIAGNDRLPIGTALSIASGATFSISSGSAARSQQVAGLSGAGTVTGSGSFQSAFSVNGNTSSTFTGTLLNGGTGGLTLTKAGTGTQTLGGSTTSNYSGGTAISGGTLVGAKSSAFGTGGVTVASGATWGVQGGITQSNAGTLAGTGAGGASGAIDNRSGTNTLSGALTLSAPATIGASSGSLTLSGGIANGGNALTFNAATSSGITVGSAGIGGSGGLIKSGAGTLTLAVTNSYTGTTTVNAGNLVVNGSIASGGSVQVNAGATLSGSGTIHSAATLATGAQLSPGTSPGILAFGDALTLGSGAFSSFEIAGTTRGTQYDGVNVAGTTSYGGTLDLAFTSLLADGTVLDLFQLGSAPVGNFNAITGSGLYAGSFSYDGGTSLWTLERGAQTLSFDPATGDLSIATAIPEPGTSALLLSLTALGLIARRRRTSLL